MFSRSDRLADCFLRLFVCDLAGVDIGFESLRPSVRIPEGFEIWVTTTPGPAGVMVTQTPADVFFITVVGRISGTRFSKTERPQDGSF